MTWGIRVSEITEILSEIRYLMSRCARTPYLPPESRPKSYICHVRPLTPNRDSEVETFEHQLSTHHTRPFTKSTSIAGQAIHQHHDSQANQVCVQYLHARTNVDVSVSIPRFATTTPNSAIFSVPRPSSSPFQEVLNAFAARRPRRLGINQIQSHDVESCSEAEI